MLKFQHLVYNPCWQTIDAAADWGFAPDQTTDVVEVALQQQYRVAAVRAFYNRTWIFSYDPATCRADLQSFDLVLISDAEYYPQHEIESWCQEVGIKNYLIALGGMHENNQINQNRMLYRHFWISHYLDRNTDQSTTADQKSFLFDAMLGARRPHRDYVMLGLTQTGLLEQSIVTYRDCFPGGLINNQTQEFSNLFPNIRLNWPYVSPNLDPAWEVSDHVNNQVSFTTPVKIFQKCYYSIITETLGTGRDFFFSEKTIKAFFARRMFVMFGNQYYLRRLKNLGFQTFGSVLDESYDSNPLDFDRFAQALEQLTYLASQDPHKILQQVAPILEHNHQRLFSLVTQTRASMDQLLQQHIPAEHFVTVQNPD